MGELQTREPAADPMISMIERAAKDPAVDVDKMERLVQIRREWEAELSKRAFYKGLSLMQEELTAVVERGEIKDGQGNVRSRYALWEDVNKQIKPVLQRHGFALMFLTPKGEGKIIVRGVLTHEDGHTEQTEVELPSDASGSKNSVQAIGSSVSYGKRYAAFALLNLTSGGEDDDGVAAGGSSDLIEWTARFVDAATLEAVEAVGAELAKAKLTQPDKAKLRKVYSDRKKALASF